VVVVVERPTSVPELSPSQTGPLSPVAVAAVVAVASPRQVQRVALVVALRAPQGRRVAARQVKQAVVGRARRVLSAVAGQPERAAAQGRLVSVLPEPAVRVVAAHPTVAVAVAATGLVVAAAPLLSQRTAAPVVVARRHLARPSRPTSAAATAKPSSP
jgi:hypothetical protein